MLLAVPAIAQTSQNLEWRIGVGDTFYYHFYYNSEPFLVDEELYANITGPMAAIPDPLTNFSDIPDVPADIKYLNGSDPGMMILFVLFSLKMAVPVGNWSLMTELVESVTSITVITETYPIQPVVIVDDWLHWGFTYNVSQTGVDNVMTVIFLKSDGYVASMRVRGYIEGTSTIMGIIDLDRDGTTPVITAPQDIDYEVGDTGNQITWNATDQSPAGYII